MKLSYFIIHASSFMVLMGGGEGNKIRFHSSLHHTITDATHTVKSYGSKEFLLRSETEPTYFDASPECECVNPWEDYLEHLKSNGLDDVCEEEGFIPMYTESKDEISYTCRPVSFGGDFCRPWDDYENITEGYVYQSEQCALEEQREFLGSTVNMIVLEYTFPNRSFLSLKL